MNKKQISISTLILVFIVAIVIGGGLGYVLTQQNAIKRALASKGGNNLREQSMLAGDNGENTTASSVTIHGSNDENSIETKTNTDAIEFEQSETVTIDGKEVFGIGTKTEKGRDGKTRTSVYLNFTKLKAFEEGTKIVDVKTIKCDEEYIVIVIDDSPLYDGGEKILVVNQRAELLGVFGVSEINTVYTYGDIENYEIKEDKIVFIRYLRDVKMKDSTEWLYGIYEVTANESFLSFKLDRICTADEIHVGGSKY